jgi:tetratricopeptide (TPR) repeat protein
MLNPFRFGPPVSSNDEFFGRELIIGKILSLIDKGMPCSIVGERRTGKTSLLLHISHPDSRKLVESKLGPSLVVYQDLQGYNDLTFDKFWRLILNESLHQATIQGLHKNVLSLHNELISNKELDTHIIRKFALQLKQLKIRLLLLLDEFEYVSHNSELDRSFFGGLRNLISSNLLVSAIIASRKQLTEIERLIPGFDITTSPLFNVFTTLNIGVFHNNDARTLCNTYLQGTTVKFTDDDFKFLFELTGYHPFFLQMASFYLYEEYERNPKVNINEKEKSVIKSFSDQCNPHFEFYWSQCSDTEKIVLGIFATADRENKKIYSKEKQAKFSSAHQSLINKALLIPSPGNRDEYRIVSSAFSTWINETLLLTDSASPLVPHQIPSPPGDFTGRTVELNALLQAHKDGACISGLKGIGGIGKTALAFALAEKLAPAYPDGQLMLNMLGTSPTPLSAADAMRQVIQVFHPEARLPENEPELKNIYLSVLHGKKILLLLDNAHSRVQVEPLIPPKTCFLLVTSRWHFTLPGLKSFDLEALSPTDAIALLLSIDPRLDSPSTFQGEGTGARVNAASTLAALCEYLPLALRLAASTLAEQPTSPVEEFLERFTDTQTRLGLTGMDASLQISYDLLPPDLQEKLRSLAIFPAPFDRPAAAAVWKVDESSTQHTLDFLVNASLLDWDDTSGFHLHDLVRYFIAVKLTEQEAYSASIRHAEHYLEVANRSNNLYLQGGDNVLIGLQMFDRNWPQIRQGQAWVSSYAVSDQDAANLCNLYPEAARYCINLRLHPEHQIVWLKAALAASTWLGDKIYQGVHQGNLGLAYSKLGQYDTAIEYYQQALTIDREIGDLRGEGQDLGNLGNAYSALGQVEKAIEYNQQALEIDREIGDRFGEGADLGNLGLAYASLGQVEQAIMYYQQALVIAREFGDRRNEGVHLGNLGLAYADLGQLHQAIDHYQQALFIAREIGDRRGEDAALGNLGLAYADLGQLDQAINHYQQALVIAREIGDRRNEGACLGNLGLAYSEISQVDKAIQYYQQALVIAREIGDRRGEGAALGNLGLAYADLSQVDKAIQYYQQALVIAREIGDRRNEGNWLGNLGLAYADLGQLEQAIEHFQQALAIAREIGDRRGEGNQLGNLALTYEAQGELGRAVPLAATSLAIRVEIKMPEQYIKKMQDLLARLREKMGEAEYQVALAGTGDLEPPSTSLLSR